jgi:hypothetical protein
LRSMTGKRWAVRIGGSGLGSGMPRDLASS